MGRLEGVNSVLKRCRELNRKINAFVQIAGNLPEKQREGPLAGMLVAVKDNIMVEGFRMEAGSKMLAGYKPAENAACVQALIDAGAVVVGKTAMDEFGMGSHSIHGTGGPVINPRRFREGPGPYSAGGSSGGSAAAVSSGLVPLALGTDTGGSIRLPASYCGIYGFKPTYGSISRHGLVSYASSLDTVGILGDSMGTVTDAFKVLSACKSAGDMTARTKMTAGRGSIDKSDCYKPMEQVTIGVPIELFTGNRLSPEAIENTEKIIEKFSMLGARIRRDISLPSLCTAAGTSTTATTAYYITAMTEAFSCLARYTANPNASIIPGGLPDGLRVELGRALGFGEQVYERISLGSILASSGAFARAQQVRQAIRAEFDAVFSSGIDVIVCPTAPSGPPLLSEVIGPADTDEGWMTDYLTVPASLAGLPAISLPVGRGGWARETVGVQLIAPAHHDQPLLHHSSQLQT